MTTTDLLQDEVSSAIDRRANAMLSKDRKKVFSDSYLHHSVWVFADYAAILLGAPSSVNAAKKRAKLVGHPFPNLVTTAPSTPALFDVAAQNFQIGHMTLSVGTTYAIRLRPDAMMRLFDVAISWSGRRGEDQKYLLSNLYLLAFGSIISADNYADYFDDMLANQIRSAREHGQPK
jgi:hypothetical protein